MITTVATSYHDFMDVSSLQVIELDRHVLESVKENRLV